MVSKEELFRQSDFVTVHVQLSARTKGLVGANAGDGDVGPVLIEAHEGPLDRLSTPSVGALVLVVCSLFAGQPCDATGDAGDLTCGVDR